MKMMHHPNMHHQPMSGHPPQHMGGHQGMPTHHQMPPHQIHRENRHVTLTRVPLGPSQAGAGMGGMGAAMGVPHHAPSQRPPHPIRAMPHHPPAQHHNVPPRGRFQQQMKPLRRPYVAGGYGPGGGVVHGYPHHHAPPAPPAPPAPAQPTQQTQPTPTHHTAVSTTPSAASAASNTKIPEASANVTATTNVIVNASTSTSASAAGAAGAGAGAEGAGAAAGDGEAARPAAGQANSKEKTPMCLVNELARYNKIKHQYRLTSEMGPAHKKVFTVTLRLGDTEEYTAEGSSIKRAQHAAASAALSTTAFPPPPPRAHPAHHPAHPHHRHSVMPTVELNALAMKLCQPAVYTSIPAVTTGMGGVPGVPGVAGVPGVGMGVGVGGGRGRAALGGVYGRVVAPTMMYRVRVAVGGRAWLGEGTTPQGARHDAAARALRDLRPPPAPAAPPAAHAAHAAPHADAHASNGKEESANSDDENGENGTDLLNSEVKSPVSMVHELALKRNLAVQFTVKSERGPPHMRVFVTICSVGDMETEGEGNGKKVSKRRAAERMLDEMRARWPAALLRARPARADKRAHPAKKKPRNLIKEGAAGAGGAGAGGAGADNPISVLAVARHVARARSPQYRVVEERGAARRREFLVRCDAPPHSATGLGPNKKTAKRRAAHNVLLAMELSTTNSNGTHTSINSTADVNVINSNADVKTASPDAKQKDGDVTNPDVRQPVPGVLLMDYHQRNHPLHNGVGEKTGPASGGGTTPGAKDQLLYLSQLLGFSVQFSDFPKRNHGEYLSLVSLSTEPPVMCHGGGASTATSHEQCARAALRALAMMGLDAPAPPAGLASAPAHDNGIASLASSGAKPPVISNGITE